MLRNIWSMLGAAALHSFNNRRRHGLVAAATPSHPLAIIFHFPASLILDAHHRAQKVLARAARAATRRWATNEVVVMAIDEHALGKWFDKSVRALTGHHFDPTEGKSIDRLALDNYLARVEAAVPPLATVTQPITTPPSVDEVGRSALLLRVFKTTTVKTWLQHREARPRRPRRSC